MEFHKPIEADFFSGVWGATQNLDSQIAEEVLLRLLDEDVHITALPIHDSFIVRRGAEEALRTAMIDAFNEVVDTDIKIDRDETVFDAPSEYGRGRLILGKDLHEPTKEMMRTHRRYHEREVQWTKTMGPID